MPGAAEPDLFLNRRDADHVEVRCLSADTSGTYVVTITGSHFDPAPANNTVSFGQGKGDQSTGNKQVTVHGYAAGPGLGTRGAHVVSRRWART